MIKVRIVQGGICTYEVQIKNSWFSPWVTVYDGCLPWRGNIKQAKDLVYKLRNKY